MRAVRAMVFFLALAPVAAMGGMPSHVKDRPLFTSFDPTGEWSVPREDGEPIRVTFKPAPFKDPQVFAVSRLGDGFGDGWAIVDGDRLYLAATSDFKQAAVLRVAVADATEDGFTQVFGSSRLSYTVATRTTPKDGGRFAGEYSYTEWWPSGTKYKEKRRPVEAGENGTYGIVWMTGVADVAGFGFESRDGRLVSARFTTRTTGGSSTNIGSGMWKVTSWTKEWSTGDLLVGAYELVDGQLVGEVVTSTGQRAEERMTRRP